MWSDIGLKGRDDGASVSCVSWELGDRLYVCMMDLVAVICKRSLSESMPYGEHTKFRNQLYRLCMWKRGG